MSIRPLPPLNTLQAFEATARHMSFTGAAQELSLTQGAISRQIRRLEEYLGKALFLRGKLGISLTPSGQRYYLVVQQSLKVLAMETSEVMKGAGEYQLTVACSLTVANYWLVPRLPELQKLYPQLQIRLLTVEDYTTLEPSAYDAGLYYCLEAPKDSYAFQLFEHEAVIAVCSSAYLDQHSDLPCRQPEDLLAHTLLIVEEHHNDWLTWDDWFTALGVTYQRPAQSLQANNYSLLMNMAIMGQGVALGWQALFQEYLDKGVLTNIVEAAIPSEGKLTLFQPGYRHQTPAVALFRQWIQTSARSFNTTI